MKIILTEQQTKKLVDSVVNEDYLSSFISALTNDSGSQTNGSTEFADEIPSGNDLMHPLGHRFNISSKFGQRNVRVGSKNHKGVDISAPSGSKVYAPTDGQVVEARDTTPNGCGGFVMLDHGNFKTKFCHLREWVVNKGDTVKKGQLIGFSGGLKSDPHRGTSTGAHLHYEILNSGGIAMNPVSVQPNLA